MPILEKDIFDAVSAWGDGLLEISNAYENSGIEKATLEAEGMLDELYGFNLGSVLFKPTLSGGVRPLGQREKVHFLTLLDKTRSILKIVVLVLNFGEKSVQKLQLFLLMRQLQCGWVG